MARRVSDLRGSTPHSGGDVPSKTLPAKLPPLPPAKPLNNGSPAVTQRRPPGRFDSRDYARAYSPHSPGHAFRVGQRAARSLPERRPAKFRRAGYLHLVQGRRRALKGNGEGPGGFASPAPSRSVQSTVCPVALQAHGAHWLSSTHFSQSAYHLVLGWHVSFLQTVLFPS